MLSGLVLVTRLVLAAVFGVAGFAKLADRKGTRKTLAGFGAPARLAGPLSVTLPAAELAVAALLLPAPTVPYGAMGAGGLLVIFGAAIVWNLAHGRTPNCHCFGQLHSTPAGWRTLARNGVLAALAGFVAVVAAGRDDPRPSIFSWSSRLDAGGWALVALAIVVVGLMTLVGLTVVHVLRAYGRVLVRLERVEVRLREAGFELEEPEDVPQLGLVPGTEAPAFALESLDSGHVDLDALLERGRPLLLLFTSPTCGPCSLLMPAVAEWQREHADALTVALVSGGEADAVRAEASAHGLANVLRDPDLATYEAYEANGTPSAVLVAADGTVGSWLAAGGDWIESLVEQTLHGSRDVAGLPIGSELPPTRLATLDGTDVVLADLVAQPTVLLFWNPACGFCRSLRQEVRAWEDDRTAGAPALIVVSSGTLEDVRSEGFVSQVVLDPEWSVSSTLGAGGTPMALLVDANGRIASPVVSGGPAVLELIGARELSPTA